MIEKWNEKVDADAFRERVWRVVSPRIGPALSPPQIDRVRALLFPEIRVTQIVLPFDDPNATFSPADDRILEVMDMQQELLARSMGEGHRIVRGVAGSGKTLILAFRAVQIARALSGPASRPVLLLSYANGISGRLENAMQGRGVEDKVITSTFHSIKFIRKTPSFRRRPETSAYKYSAKQTRPKELSHLRGNLFINWIPAYAGMTGNMTRC